MCFYEGREDPNTTKSGPSSARQRNAIEMAFRWRADNGQTLNAGLVAFTVIFQQIRINFAKKNYSIVIFQGRVRKPYPGDQRMLVQHSISIFTWLY